MKRVLIVNSKFTYGKINYGGVNKMLLWLGNSLHKEGYNVEFCTLYDTERADRIDKEIPSYEYGINYYSSYWKRNFYFLKDSYSCLNKHFKTHQYDYVVSFDGLAFFTLLALRNKYKYKFVVSERSDPNNNHSAIAVLHRKLYKYVDLLVCQTEGAKNCFSKKIQEKSVVIPNPIEIPAEQWSSGINTCAIACVGRLDIWQKRQDVLLRAFKSVHDTHANYILNIYGSGPDEDKLKSLTEELDITDSVVFNGAVSNVNSLLMNNELYVISSDFEGIPNTLLEAMALGMPVVATKCSPGGAEFLINNNENGVLVDCNNPAQLADAINYMIENRDKAANMGSNARTSVNRFVPSKIIQLWKSVFK